MARGVYWSQDFGDLTAQGSPGRWPWLRFANVGEHNSMILGYLGFMVDISKLDGEKSTDFLEVAPPCNNGGCMSN